MLRSRTSPFIAFVTLSIVLLSLPGVARAVPVAPGGTVSVPFEGDFTPTGTLAVS